MQKPAAAACLAVLFVTHGCLARGESEPEASQAPPEVSTRIVAYTWEPVTPAADRLVYAIRVKQHRYDQQQVVAALRAMPPGHRAIRLWRWARPQLTRHPDDRCRRADGTLTDFWYPQPEAGIAVVRARWRAFVQALHQAGAPLDEVILDFEKVGYGMWKGMQGEDKTAHLAAIRADPRFRGIVSSDAEDLEDLSRVHDSRSYDDHLTWNATMRRVVDDALQKAIYEPLIEFYPAARCSNYTSRRVLKSLAIPTQKGGHLQWVESDGFGTHDTIAAYGQMGDVKNEPLRDGRPLGDSPYSGLLYTIKQVESVSNSSSRPLKVWVAPKRKYLPMPVPFRDTPYHDELVRHLLVRRHDLLLFNSRASDDRQMLEINALISQCATVIGETGSTMAHTTAWASDVIQSRTHNGDDVIRRFTLEHPEKPLRYRINGTEYERSPTAGEVGLWVRHARGDEFVLRARP